ncbi:MAG TPA: 3D domain-containing protein [Caulobacteraceae bacterium]|nr:3D domain-containing protein [Caulobacteraceae bacterium]
MIAGIAAVALAAAAPADPPARPAIPVIAPPPAIADPIGEIIRKTEDAAADAAQTLETQVKATLYYAKIKGMRGRDSLGCKLAPMRTVAVDPSVFPRHSVLFIKQTVGMKMPDGTLHDGFWYASDVGGAIKGLRVDLFTGVTAKSMQAFHALNLATLSAVKVGSFEGCPSARSPAPAPQQIAANTPPN